MQIAIGERIYASKKKKKKIWKVFSKPNMSLPIFIINKYGLGSIEGIARVRSTATWRWRDISAAGNLITN